MLTGTVSEFRGRPISHCHICICFVLKTKTEKMKDDFKVHNKLKKILGSVILSEFVICVYVFCIVYIYCLAILLSLSHAERKQH